MKIINLHTALLLMSAFNSYAQKDSVSSQLSIEPAIGISPMPLVDMTLTNIVQWNFSKNINAISYTSLKENNLFIRNFNHIRSTNNHSITQKVGIGLDFKTKRSIHTVSMLAGLKYDTYRETMNNPEFEKLSVKIESWSPDIGFMYNLKLGQKKYFLSYRMYIPLFPYPTYTTDFTSVTGNLANVSLELGLGIRLLTK